jgi:hypothetical protein
MRSHFFILVSGVRKRLKTAGHQPRNHLTPRHRGAAGKPACLMASDPQPPGEVKADVTA